MTDCDNGDNNNNNNNDVNNNDYNDGVLLLHSVNTCDGELITNWSN